MNELAMSNEHAGMRDAIGRAAEKEKVAGAESFSLDRIRTWPCRLQVGVSRHDDSTAAHKHLRETRTVEPQAGRARPGVSGSKKAASENDGLVDRQLLRRKVQIPALHPGPTSIDQPHLHPALIVALSFSRNFQVRL